MKRIARTVYLPADLSEWLTGEADRRGISGNAILVTLLERERDERRQPNKPASLDGDDRPMDFD